MSRSYVIQFMKKYTCTLYIQYIFEYWFQSCGAYVEQNHLFFDEKIDMINDLVRFSPTIPLPGDLLFQKEGIQGSGVLIPHENSILRFSTWFW